MCFVLYAGTTHPIPRKEWLEEAPDVTAVSLSEREHPITAHFSKPEIQYVTSTAGCGCDFPYITFQNGEWVWFDTDDRENEAESTERRNRERLVALLRETKESTVELYGVWDGAFDFSTPPAIREEIVLERIRERDFRFKEQGFYIVKI